MGYKLNVFSGTLDLVGSSGGGASGVTRVGSTNDKRIVRWRGDDMDTIENTQAYIQDSGAIVAQGYITNRQVSGAVDVPANHTWIADTLEMQPGAIVTMNPGSRIIIGG